MREQHAIIVKEESWQGQIWNDVKDQYGIHVVLLIVVGAIILWAIRTK